MTEEKTPVDDDNAGNGSRKRRAALWRWWRRYDAWTGRYDWMTWLMSSKAGTATAVAAVGAAAVGGGVVTYQQLAKYEEPPAQAVAAAPQRVSDSSIIFTVEGFDKAGRRGLFDVVVLAKNFGWVRKSTSELVRDGTVLSGPDVAAQVFNEEVRASFSRAKAIIAGGVASQEGDAVVETERAANRAKQSAAWLAPIAGDSVPVWTLNLGQYRQPCADCATSGTDWQRPLIVVAVRELAENADMGEALADALRGKSNLPSPESYSVYELSRYR